jgi:bifunctional DNA-binding transcriptional regulator/antitoxin component of YhaV-PrlF toxin-antitoxin module
MADELTITAKGQVTLRKSVLTHLGVTPGQRVTVSLLPNGRVALSAAATAHDLGQLRGVLRRKGQKRVSLKEMQAAIEAIESVRR